MRECRIECMEGNRLKGETKGVVTDSASMCYEHSQFHESISSSPFHRSRHGWKISICWDSSTTPIMVGEGKVR